MISLCSLHSFVFVSVKYSFTLSKFEKAHEYSFCENCCEKLVKWENCKEHNPTSVCIHEKHQVHFQPGE